MTIAKGEYLGFLIVAFASFIENAEISPVWLGNMPGIDHNTNDVKISVQIN